MNPIAYIRTGFHTKFGIPRQSGIVSSLKGSIIFQPEYRNLDALRGLEEFSHIWLIWLFSESVRENWSPTVRPPRLGGNTRIGVFATRSPFRPNPIGLSCVTLESVELSTPDGPVLHVSGADLMDGTPIYDIKPYLTYTDCHPEATSGFTGTVPMQHLKVIIPDNITALMPQHLVEPIKGILAEDPRPRYQHNPEREYRMEYSGYDIAFTVPEKDTAMVTGVTKKLLADTYNPSS